jgi:F420H(2)-dependent quinone reductase
MTTPAEPRFRGVRGFRNLNAHMAHTILAAEPAPYEEGGYVRRVLEIRGRRTGTVHSVPLAVVTLFGGNYLVSPRSERNWVRNLAANPSCLIRTRDTSEARYAVRVIDRARAVEVICTYVQTMRAPWAIAQFPFSGEATREQIAAVADRVAVFELTKLQ